MELKPEPIEQKEKVKLNILIADDYEGLRGLLKIMLESMGHKVKAVEDGKLLFNEITKGNNSYDVVISDNSMPGKKGMEVLRDIRLIERFKKFPFILVTTDISEGGFLEKEVNELGAFFLRKPFSLEQISEAIDKVTKDKV